MVILLGFFSVLLAALVLPLCLYLGLLALLARREPPAIASRSRSRFVVIVPAHNEEQQIAATVDSLLSVDYLAGWFAVVVVADNCTDRTAAVARTAGATVWMRTDGERRGKGHALAWAFERALAETGADAVVVVDADTVVAPNLLRAYAKLLSAGAQVIQAEYGVRNARASWRTRLMSVAFGMFHRTRSLARERLGLSAGLRGNGMCFSRSLLLAVPYRAFGLVEDVEYGIEIGLAGLRVAYAADASVYGEMASHGSAARSQRRRWEEGRRLLARAKARELFDEAWRRRSLTLLDYAFDLVVPPLSTLAILVLLGCAFEVLMWVTTGGPTAGVWLWGIALAMLFLYVARGVQYSGLGAGGIVALVYAPFYVLWKIVKVGWERPSTWVRTQREAEKGVDA